MSTPTLQQIQQRLTGKGLKPTHQRIIIYEALLHSGLHPSAEQIHEQLRQQHPSLSLGTVYRTLEKLVEAGLVKRVGSPEGLMLFDANAETHHHLVSREGHAIRDYENPELHRLIADYLAAHPIGGFQVQDFQLQIFGAFHTPASE